MTYVMGDIHGRYDKYTKMLIEIGLKDKDDLYVIGDMIDKGSEPVKVIKDMSMRANVFPILGDCEYTALKIFKSSKQKNDAQFKSSFENWMKSGGRSTAQRFAELDVDDREALIEYLEELPLFEEIIVNGEKYILVHAGLSNFKKERPLDDYSPSELIFEKADTDVRYFSDAVLITGHKVHGEKILRKNGHMAINCGEGEDEPLCAVCLDTGREYYV